MTSEQLLIQRYGHIRMTVKDLADFTGMGERSVQNAISAGRFPIKTVRLCGRRYADVRDVAEYWDKQRSA